MAENGTAPASIVVALCASGADRTGPERVLASLPPLEGMAVVVVLQRREALDETRFRQGLAEAGREVSAVESGAVIEAGRIYLPAPDLIVTVEDGRFLTRPAEQRPGERGTVDTFLVSLAREEDGRAIAVLFPLADGDGTLGAAAVKEAGGLVLADEREERRAGDLASSSSPAALADLVLPAEELARRIALHVRQIGQAGQAPSPDAPETEAALKSIAATLRNSTGHDFHGYKRGTFLRRVQRRMPVVQAESLEGYVEILRAQPDEVRQLFNDLLIGVTQFFRDAGEFERLEREVIPRLFEGKGRGDQLRLWVIGCSTGEEAYSLAILLREHMAGLDEVPSVQIFATDLDGRALATARAGRYKETVAKEVSPERLARWFVREGDTYCVVKDLREMCIFSQHSIIKDAPFSRIDLLSCRNLLIYLDAELQTRVIPLFHFSLRPGGFLFLGTSENVSRHTALFAPIEPRSRIFRRLETGTRVLPDFAFAAVDRRLVDVAAPVSRARALEGDLTRRAERIAERYAPAYVIVDEAANVLHFSGRIGRYLEPAGGAASLNLLALVHPDLRSDLRAALAQAAEQSAPVQVDGLSLGLNGSRLLVELVVEPVQDGAGSGRSYVVLFRDGAAAPAREGGAGPAPDSEQRIHELERELSRANERLRATVEDLESANEELKSSNEEYQSLNEELQSANEELETSKEELQSVNEELTTVNGELAHRVQELGRVNSDLKNLLESTQIATLFLDSALKVTNFTPAVAELFHLVQTDIGRPVEHIKARVAYEELQEDARRVLRTLGSVDRQVTLPGTDRHYMARVLPYRTVDNFIGGVVITFTEITPVIEAQRALRESERQAKLLLAELQHRVRNTLSVIRSIARRTAATSETAEDYAMHLDGRIESFARVQAAVTRNPLSGVDLAMLVAEELLAHGGREGDRVVSPLTGPSVRLRAKAAETFGLAVHELATNAVKYGALSARRGRLRVEWTVEGQGEPRRLVFVWTETGVALPEGEPKQGFGRELIERMLAYELGGEAHLQLGPDGVQCRIELPLTDKIAVL